MQCCLLSRTSLGFNPLFWSIVGGEFRPVGQKFQSGAGRGNRNQGSGGLAAGNFADARCASPSARLTRFCPFDSTFSFQRTAPNCRWDQFSERVEGIEPSAKAWKALVLPLYDTRARVNRHCDFRKRRKRFPRLLQSPCRSRFTPKETLTSFVGFFWGPPIKQSLGAP